MRYQDLLKQANIAEKESKKGISIAEKFLQNLNIKAEGIYILPKYESDIKHDLLTIEELNDLLKREDEEAQSVIIKFTLSSFDNTISNLDKKTKQERNHINNCLLEHGITIDIERSRKYKYNSQSRGLDATNIWEMSVSCETLFKVLQNEREISLNNIFNALSIVDEHNNENNNNYSEPTKRKIFKAKRKVIPNFLSTNENKLSMKNQEVEMLDDSDEEFSNSATKKRR